MSGTQPRVAEWYFDVVSPYAYLQAEQFHRLPASVTIRPRPMVLGAVLSHWGIQAPADLPAKRRMTYRTVLARARARSVPFRMPPFHPFRSIEALRLLVACGQTVAACRTVLGAVWGEGMDVTDPADWARLCDRLGVAAEGEIGSEAVKAALRRNTDDAIAAGVFGSPTLLLDGELFWGDDATDLFLEFVENPALFQEAEWRRISDLPDRRG